MGNSCSAIQDNDTAFLVINNEANRILKMILCQDCNSRQAVSQQIGCQKIEELCNSFNSCTLEAVSNKLGICGIQSNKKQTCVNIVNFYLNKLNVEKCNMYNELYEKFNTEEINTRALLEMYNKMKDFNQAIRGKFSDLESELEKIKDTECMPSFVPQDNLEELEREVEAEAFNMPSQAFAMPSTSYGMPGMPGSPRAIRSPAIEPAGSVFTMSSMKQPSLVSSMANVKVETRERQIPGSPFKERITTRETQVPGSPIKQRTVTRENGMQKSIVKETTVQPIIHNVVQEVPVHHRTIYKPVIVKREVVTEDLPEEPLVPVEPVKRNVIVPVPIPSPVRVERELPVIPVHTLPHVSTPPVAITRSTPAVVRQKTVTVRKNVPIAPVVTPKVVSVTRTVQRVPSPVVLPAPVVSPLAVPVAPTVNVVGPSSGVPVRAIADHYPMSPNEVPLRKGQATSYIKSGQRGWAYVRHADGTEGYVPAGHLSV